MASGTGRRPGAGGGGGFGRLDPEVQKKLDTLQKEAVANSQACPSKIVNPWQPAVKLKVHSDNGCNIALINPKGFRT